MNRVMYGVVVAALQLADWDDHIEFFCAEAREGSSFLAQRGDERSAKGESDDNADGNASAGENFDGRGNPHGFTIAQANR